MAYEWGPRNAESYPAGVDLTDKQYFIGVLGTDRKVVLPSAAGQATGVIEYTFKPVVGATIALVTEGVTKVRLGGTVAVGDSLSSAADGRVIKNTGAASSGIAFGVAREAGVAGQIIAAAVSFVGARTY